jgi:hypothetical protein
MILLPSLQAASPDIYILGEGNINFFWKVVCADPANAEMQIKKKMSFFMAVRFTGWGRSVVTIGWVLFQNYAGTAR